MKTPSILITGCSSGIGYCAAKLLKQRGYRVFASARKESDVERLTKEGFDSLLLDVRDLSSIQHAFDQIITKTGGTLDAVFNNAAYMQVGGTQDLTLDIIKAQFETNTFGAMAITRRALQIMQEQGHGRIIQNSSILGVITVPYYGAYNASKFALEAYTRTLRQELMGSNIHVSLINPGPIVTNIKQNAYAQFKSNIQERAHHSIYEDKYEAMEKAFLTTPKEGSKLAQPPEAVVKKLIHALESKRPKVHYFIGWPAQLMATLQRILPDRTMDWVISKVT